VAEFGVVIVIVMAHRGASAGNPSKTPAAVPALANF
jgi:glycerophosphoryl diester phosphodiesterase